MADDVYSREQVERWQEKLEKIALLPRTRFTKKQVVDELIDTIEKALETRSYDEVAKELAADGLDISAGSLKQYVSKYRRSHPSTKPMATGQKRAMKAKKDSSNGQLPNKAAEDDSSQAEPQVTGTANEKPKRFIGMAEDL